MTLKWIFRRKKMGSLEPICICRAALDKYQYRNHEFIAKKRRGGGGEEKGTGTKKGRGVRRKKNWREACRGKLLCLKNINRMI